MSRKRAIGRGVRRVTLVVLVIFLVAIAAAACARRSAASPALPQPTAEDRGAAVPVEPPARYREWWRQVESCSGKSRSIDSVAGWYAVLDTVIFVGGRPYAAVYFGQSDELFFARRFLYQPFIVRHEMLHALLRTPANDSVRHPDEFFRTRCGAFVSPPHDP
jgi:hypothetical protein